MRFILMNFSIKNMVDLDYYFLTDTPTSVADDFYTAINTVPSTTSRDATHHRKLLESRDHDHVTTNDYTIEETQADNISSGLSPDDNDHNHDIHRSSLAAHQESTVFVENTLYQSVYNEY